MHGVVTLLEPPHYEQVEAIWDELERECGLQGVRVTPFPHVSWHVAADYRFDALADALREVAAAARPFTVRSGGLGVFTGQQPVIYVPVEPSEELLALHRAVWRCTAPLAVGASAFYEPGHWAPHITLVFGDGERSRIGQAMGLLAFRSFAWELPVRNLAVLYQPPGQTAQLAYRLPLGRP